MLPLATFVTPQHNCAYRPGESARLRYELVAAISPAEYQARMAAGWRRFGHSLFTHDCPKCSACQSLRVLVDEFQPNRSQRRAWAANADVIVTICEPSVNDEKLELYDRFHEFQTNAIGWPDHGPKDAFSYHESFVQQPFRVEEWQFLVQNRLVGVGYVDPLPESLSAIYFFHDPDCRDRSLGTFNVLKVIEAAKNRSKPHVYLGYFVAGCRSLEYKARFQPIEIRGPEGVWRPSADAATIRPANT